ncbi:MAG: adenosylmethionine decarboxylase [Pseudomonadota bacterium]
MNNPLKNNLYAPGTHIILDFFDAKYTNDMEYVEQSLRKVANICNATILNVKLHSFGKDSGITGVLLLAESHITIHTWPEINFIALDIFMCGKCDARLAIEPLKEMFSPKSTNIKEVNRGIQ